MNSPLGNGMLILEKRGDERVIRKRSHELSVRHQDALQYAINMVQQSPLKPYVKDLILYGSCARKEQKYSSDVDLLLVLDEKFLEDQTLRTPMRLLKSQVSTDDPEVDLKIVVGDDWKSNNMQYFKNIRKEGISVWH